MFLGPLYSKPQILIRARALGITTLLFLKIRLYFVGNLSNFDKICKLNFVLACTYSNGQHDPLPPTAEAAQQRTGSVAGDRNGGKEGWMQSALVESEDIVVLVTVTNRIIFGL